MDRAHKTCTFAIAAVKSSEKDADEGTLKRGTASCPFCNQSAPVDYIREESRGGALGQRLIAVIWGRENDSGKVYREATEADQQAFAASSSLLPKLLETFPDEIRRDEAISTRQPRLMWITTYGITHWDGILNDRQKASLLVLARGVSDAYEQLRGFDKDYAVAVATLLSMILDRQVNQNTTLCRMDVTRETLQGTYACARAPNGLGLR